MQVNQMPRYWVIAPVESNPPDLFDRVWHFDLANSCISIGWNALGDVSHLTRDQISDSIAAVYPEKPPASRSLVRNMLWSFFHDISVGDIILARRGRKTLAGVGIVKTVASFHGAANAHASHPESTHLNFLEVDWQSQPRDKKFPFIAFPMYTLAEFSEEQYNNVVGQAAPIIPVEDSSPSQVDETIFVLEKYLEDFIVGNFEAIFKGQLQIFTDPNGYFGQQYTTDIGPIDILATEPESGSFVVIELKRNRPSDQVVGQILRYMGWVKEKLCKPGQIVKGLVICRSPDNKLSYALSMTTNIDIRYHSVSFKLSEIA